MTATSNYPGLPRVKQSASDVGNVRNNRPDLMERATVVAGGGPGGTGGGDAWRGRLCLGVGDAHGLGNTGRTLLALDLDGPLVCHANAAVWHVVGGEQLLAAADARTNLHGVGEAHFVRAVVYAVPHIVDLEYIPAEGSDHGQGKIAVCDRLAVRHIRLA